MTTYRAVAATTAAFAQRIKQSISPLDGAIVTTERPSAPVVGGPPRVNLFLYHVDANPFTTTDDLPTRRPDGTLMQRPRIALDLYYLLSFYGDDKLPALEPHVLIGLTMSGLHARPVLSAEELGHLEGETLACDFIALTPLPLSIHELSRLWSMFFQVPYTVSVSLKASAAVLIADLPAGEALPVQRRGLEVVLYEEPRIASVEAPGGGPLVYGREVLVAGSGFGGDGTVLAIGEAILRLPSGGVIGSRILARLRGDGLRAGRQALSVVTTAGFRAPGVGILLRPAVTGVEVAGATLTVKVEPEVGADQRAELLLNRLGPVEPGAQTEFTLDAEAAGAQLSAQTAGLPGGRYAVRARIDGAESLLSIDPLTGEDRPSVNLAAGA